MFEKKKKISQLLLFSFFQTTTRPPAHFAQILCTFNGSHYAVYVVVELSRVSLVAHLLCQSIAISGKTVVLRFEQRHVSL